jgi:hypothetical protein
MKRSQRAALLILLNREMRKHGNWCGETHLQKAVFLLQELVGVDAGFEFILYRHGPFSFGLRDELAAMQADDLLELAVRQQGYGPTYNPTQFSEEFLERFPKTTARYSKQIEFVASELGDMGVTDLEKLATALYIAHRQGIDDVSGRAQRLVELKPHISTSDAYRASEQVDRLIARARPYNVAEEQEHDRLYG